MMSRTNQRQMLMKQQMESEIKQQITADSLPPFQLPVQQQITQNNQFQTHQCLPQHQPYQQHQQQQEQQNQQQQQLQQLQQPPTPTPSSTQTQQQQQQHRYETTDYFDQLCYEYDLPGTDQVSSTLPHPATYVCGPATSFAQTPPPSLPNSNGFPLFATTAPKPSILSSSCPVGPADISNLKERQKKDNHNKIEQRRRENINCRIKELRQLLKDGSKYSHLLPSNKLSKGNILKVTVDVMMKQNKEVETLGSIINEKDRQIEQLKQSLESVQRLLSSHRIDSPIGSLLSPPTNDSSSFVDENKYPMNSIVQNSHTNFEQEYIQNLP